MGALDLSEEPVSTGKPLDLTGSAQPQHSDTYLPDLGAKLHISLGPDSPGLSEVTTSLGTGNDLQYKKLLADRDVLNQQQSRNNILQSVLQADPKMLTPEVVGVVQDLSTSEIQSPDLSDIIEKKYAQTYTNLAAAGLDNDVLTDSMTEDANQTHDLLDRSERLAFKNQVAQSAMSVLSKEADDRSFLSKTESFVERMIPFREWYVKQNAVGKGSAMVSSILPGSNIEEQYAYLWGLPPEEFSSTFKAAVSDMKERNIDIAQTWVQGFMSYGGQSAVVDNLMGIADVASVIPVSKVATLGKALSGVVKGGLKSPMKVSEIAADLGRYREAADGKVIEDIKSGNFFGTDIKKIEDLEASVPSLTSPNKMIQGGTSLPQEAINRLKTALIERSERARQILTDPNLIDRVTPEELQSMISSVRTDFEKHYPNINKNVIGVEPGPVDLGNVYTANIVIGRRDGTLFESAAQAENYVKKVIKPVTNDFRVEQKGSGFQVVIPKTLDESRLLSDLTLGTTQKTPTSLTNQFAGWLRSPDYTLPKQNVEARGVAVHTSEMMAHAMEEITAPLGRLGKSEFNEVNDLLIVNRQSQEFYETLGDFEKAFFDRFKKNPSEAQVDAYTSYVQANDLDLVIRDLDWYKQKARLGLEDMTVRVGKENLQFEGKVLNELPAGEYRISTIEDGVASKVKSSKYLSQKELSGIQKKLEDGWKLVEAASPVQVGQKSFADYILTKAVKRDRVGVKNVDRKAGGHKVMQYDYYVKQPILSEETAGRRYYQGDKTLYNAPTQKEADEIAALFEEARLKLKNNSPDAMTFIRDRLPITTRDFMAAVKRGDIDLDTPFVGTKKGLRTIDHRNIPDVIQAPNSDKYRMVGSYGGARDTSDIPTIRSEGNGVFETQPAAYLSPIDTLRSSSANALNTRTLNDYALMTNQNFIREFGDILDADMNTLQASGFSYLMEPKFVKGADPTRIAAAKNISRAFNGLMNYGTSFDRQLTSFKEKLLSGIADRLGPKGATWVDENMFSRVKNSGVALRSMAFDLKLGFFNPQQLFIQANSLVQVASIAGRDGLRGGLVYPLFRGALLTSSDEVLKGIAKSVERTGVMKASEFEESLRLFKQSGFNSIGKDVAYLDDLKGPDIRTSQIGGAWKSFLQAGRTPFNEGERIVRIASWNAAYLERKKLVGMKALDRRDVAAILQRAKDLGGNMTRDSNAAWQKGGAAVLTQFFGFQARIMEQMLGKKLTGAERLRLFAGFSAMYGVPTAMGAGAGILPVPEIVKQTLSDMGVDYQDNEASKIMIDGFGTELIKYATGVDTNFPARYGPGGIPNFYDFLRGDKTAMDMFMGASGSIGLQTVQDAFPIVRGMASEYLDYKGGLYTLTQDDIVKPFRNISTVNNALNLYQVYGLGVWSSRNGVDLTKMDLPEGVLAALTGLQPERIEQSFTKLKSVQSFKEFQQSEQKEIVSRMRQYMRMEDGPTRESLVREVKARMEIDMFDLRMKAETWRRAASHEMTDDVFFKKYEDLLKRKESQNGQ